MHRIREAIRGCIDFAQYIAAKAAGTAQSVIQTCKDCCGTAVEAAALIVGIPTGLFLHITGLASPLFKLLGIEDSDSNAPNSTTTTVYTSSAAPTSQPRPPKRIIPKYSLDAAVTGLDADVLHVKLAQCRSRSDVKQLLQQQLVHRILSKPDSPHSSAPRVPVLHREGLLLTEWEQTVGARLAATCLLNALGKLQGTNAPNGLPEHWQHASYRSSSSGCSSKESVEIPYDSFDGCLMGIHASLSGSSKRSSGGGGGATSSGCSSVQGSVASFSGACRVSAGGSHIYMLHGIERSAFATACQ